MTAVEWLATALYENFEMKGDGEKFDELLQQAKQMEKEQIMNAVDYGPDYNKAEDYYKETYKRGLI